MSPFQMQHRDWETTRGQLNDANWEPGLGMGTCGSPYRNLLQCSRRSWEGDYQPQATSTGWVGWGGEERTVTHASRDHLNC